MNSNIQEAMTILNKGGIVIFPTDTAFGIGCRVDNEEAVKRLYTIRRRPASQAASLLVSSMTMVEDYVTTIPKDVEEELIKKHWPGGLTIVLQSRSEKIPALVRGGGDTIGVRMPDHTDLVTLISHVGVPILGPSANFHGNPTPFTFADLDPLLIKEVDYVFEGSCKGQKASTVIDCTVNPWKVLREGAVTIQV